MLWSRRKLGCAVVAVTTFAASSQSREAEADVVPLPQPLPRFSSCRSLDAPLPVRPLSKKLDLRRVSERAKLTCSPAASWGLWRKGFFVSKTRRPLPRVSFLLEHGWGLLDTAVEYKTRFCDLAIGLNEPTQQLLARLILYAIAFR